jgi:hypothetical protein
MAKVRAQRSDLMVTSGQQAGFRQGPLFVLAGCALACGGGVYLFVRGPETLYLLRSFETVPLLLAFRIILPDSLTTIASSLPSFTHTFAFSLFTAALMYRGRRRILHGCLLWACLGSIFEFLQASRSSSYAPVSDYVLPRIVRAYIENGRFDWLDLAAIWVGAGMAGLVLYQIIRIPDFQGRKTDVYSLDRPSESRLGRHPSHPRQLGKEATPDSTAKI